MKDKILKKYFVLGSYKVVLTFKTKILKILFWKKVSAINLALNKIIKSYR